MKINLNLSLSTKRNRIYPEVSEGDRVKIFRKKGIGEKERISTWSQNVFTVERVEKKLGQNYYSPEGMDRVFLRFELQKV